MFGYNNLILLFLCSVTASAGASECYVVNNLTGYTNFLQAGKYIKDGMSASVQIDISGKTATVYTGGDYFGEFNEMEKESGFYLLTRSTTGIPHRLITVELMTINKKLKKISFLKSMNGVAMHNFGTNVEDDVSDIQVLSGDYTLCERI